MTCACDTKLLDVLDVQGFLQPQMSSISSSSLRRLLAAVTPAGRQSVTGFK